MNVEPVPIEEVRPWILKRHYAHRMPCVQFSFGLFEERVLMGVVTYGPTPTPAVQQNILGLDWSDKVYELNRLCVESRTKNASSYLVACSLKLLPKPSCIVSYADSAQGHVGYIYQATNFLYTGAVTAHDAEYIIDGKKTHARSITASGIPNPTQWARENGIERVEAQPKHRYVMLLGNKREKKEMLKLLRYPVVSSYPKGDTKRYDADKPIDKQFTMF